MQAGITPSHLDAGTMLPCVRCRGQESRTECPLECIPELCKDQFLLDTYRVSAHRTPDRKVGRATKELLSSEDLCFGYVLWDPQVGLYE